MFSLCDIHDPVELIFITLKRKVVTIHRENKIRNILNYAALGLAVLYFIIVVVSILVGYFSTTLDDEYVFWFIMNVVLWGGVILLFSVLFLMMLKLAILKK